MNCSSSISSSWLTLTMIIFVLCSLMNSSQQRTYAFQPQTRRVIFKLPSYSQTKHSSSRSFTQFLSQDLSSLGVSRSHHDDENNNTDKISSNGHDYFWLGKHNSKRRKVTNHLIGAVSSLTSLKMTKNDSSNNSNSNSVKVLEEANDFSPLSKIAALEQENKILRRTVSSLEDENVNLLNRQVEAAKQVVIEQFEGEGKPMFDVNGEEIESWWEEDDEEDSNTVSPADATAVPLKIQQPTMATSKQPDRALEKAGDDYDIDACPMEPDISFKEALQTRAKWLIGLLAMQSMSGLILARNEELLKAHPIIIYFLTMLVGAGGNAGNQASVRVIRGLALGTLNENTQKQFLNREFKMAGALSALLAVAGFLRAIVFRTPLPETIAITTALTLIVFTSVCLGAILPLLLKKIDIDPAHSSTSIQVVMDILGVVLTVIVSTAILDGPLGQILMSMLGR